MGSLSRIDRASRFIDEFSKDYVARGLIQPGMSLRVLSVGLGMQNDGEEVVTVFARVQLPDDREMELRLVDEGIVFDPEYDHADELVTKVGEALDISEELATARLLNAELIEEV